ncbi:MAG: hypothetical protein MEQ74_11945 [Paracoccus sp.]|nr:hypothetical protein [Paracoccus sp. (in: a-proteobacteria)]
MSENTQAPKAEAIGFVELVKGSIYDRATGAQYDPGDVVPVDVWQRSSAPCVVKTKEDQDRVDYEITPIIAPGLTDAELHDAIREAGPGPIIANANIGKLDASKITIKDEAEPALFTIDTPIGKVQITATGVETIKGDHDGTLMAHAMAALPLILERERDRVLYHPHPPISLEDAAATIRLAIEEGTDAEVDQAGDIIAELVRFIGRADDDAETELAQAIAHERKRAQAEEAERAEAKIKSIMEDHARTAEKLADAFKGEAHTGVAEGLIAAGSLDCTSHYAKVMSEAQKQAQTSGKAFVRLTYGHGEGMQAELVEAMAEVPSPVTEDHEYTSNTETSMNAETGRVTETTTTTHSYTRRR